MSARPDPAHLRTRAAAMALLVVISGSLANAEPKSKTTRKRAAAAQAAWRRCFPQGSAVPGFPDLDLDEPSPGGVLDVRRTRTGFHVAASWSGNGVEAMHGGITLELEPRGCRALWAEDATHDGALATRVRIGWTRRDAPTERELRALVAEPARPSDPAHAAPRAWLTHACPGGPDSELAWTKPIAGPIAPAQPWHPGAPRRPPSTFWPISALDGIGARAALRPSDEDEDLPRYGGPELAGIMVLGIGPPRRTLSAAGVELFEAELGGRNAGRAIALRDPATDRHRWVVVTRGCVQGTTVTWLGAVGSRIVGITHSRHGRYARGDAILIIDVPTGTAWAVRFPGTIRDATEADDGVVQASRTGSQLTLRVGAVSAELDLAPLLALIPASP